MVLTGFTLSGTKCCQVKDHCLQYLSDGIERKLMWALLAAIAFAPHVMRVENRGMSV